MSDPRPGALLDIFAALLAVAFAGQRFLGALLLARFQIERVPLDLFDDIFLLHFTLKTTQCIFQGLTFLNADFSHLDFTVLPMHVANIAVNHIDVRRQPY